MSEQLMDALGAVRDALDIPEGASAAAERIRGKVLRTRAEQVIGLLEACTGGEDVAAGVADLRAWLTKNPIRYVTAEQAWDSIVAESPREFRTYVGPGSVLPLPCGGLPAWVGASYLARLWGVHRRTVTKWADGGLLTAAWLGAARRFSREAVQDFARYAINVALVKPGMVVQHPEWADGMPVRIVSAAVGHRQLWQVTYSISSDGASSAALEAAPPCRGNRMVLRYPAKTAAQ